MKADLTRNTFDPLKHYARVLMQQGRVQMDSDWNEQAAILLHHLRTLAADLIGPAGGPGDNGFALSGPLPVPGDFSIGLGHYYVDGILCEADADSLEVVVTAASEVQVSQSTLDGRVFDANRMVELFDDVGPMGTPAFPPTVVLITGVNQATRKLTLQTTLDLVALKPLNPSLRGVITYLTQPDYPNPGKIPAAADANFLVYLDVWERHLTWIEDDSIREVALGGPDTASRSKVVWQVKAAKGQPTSTDKPCDKFKFDDTTLLGKLLSGDRGRLKAMAKQKSASTDPCIIAPDANFRGPENQLYRVEIHSPGVASKSKSDFSGGTSADGTGGAPGIATFKWSRENGSVTYPIIGSMVAGSGVATISLASLGRDDRYGLVEGDWVEIQDDDYMLRGQAGNLLKVQSLDRSRRQVILAGTVDPGIGTDPAKHPLLRRWEQKQGDPAEGGLTLAKNGAAILEERNDAMWLSLEDGVQIQFQSALAGRTNLYRTGDYWLIPARTATEDVEWPTETVTDSQGNSVTSPLAKPPLGIRHHYAPLGVVAVAAGGTVTVLGDKQNTCRKSFK